VGPNIAPRKKHGLKNIKRRNSYFSVSITAPKKTLVQKEYEVQKIWNSDFFGTNTVPKKEELQKKYGFKKKELILLGTFLPNQSVFPALFYLN
jgi:hypothetical protein